MTKGEIAYEAYKTKRPDLPYKFNELPANLQDAWETAAQAAIEEAFREFNLQVGGMET